jgi:hypothetical protein
MTENLIDKILNHIDILDKSTKTLGALQTKNAADREAFIQLLIEKGVFTKEEFLIELRQDV